jgi:hypothetical protein
MSMSVGELKDWLSRQDEEEWIAIDDGELTLVTETGGYYEIGGTPRDDEV